MQMKLIYYTKFNWHIQRFYHTILTFMKKLIYYTILIFMQKKLMYNTILIFIQLLSVYYKIFTKHLITTQTARICSLSDFLRYVRKIFSFRISLFFIIIHVFMKNVLIYLYLWREVRLNYFIPNKIFCYFYFANFPLQQ